MSRFLRMSLALCSALVLLGAQHSLLGWGATVFNSDWHAGPYVQVSAGGGHTVAIRSDGTIVAWGANTNGLANVPPLPPGLQYLQAAGGWRHTVAALSDGSFVAWGGNGAGQGSVPPLPTGGSAYVQVAAGWAHTVALRSDGTAVAWGSNTFGQVNAPPLPPGRTYAQIAAGSETSVALLGGPLPPRIASIGAGCAGANGATMLASAELPYLGNPSFRLHVGRAAAGSQAYLFFAIVPASQSLALGSGCAVHLDLTSLSTFVGSGVPPFGHIPTGPRGTASFWLAVPPDPQLAGAFIAFQALVPDAMAPLGFTLSNGVECRLN